MIDYHKLSESELDLRLLVAYLPKRESRLAFSDHNTFFQYLYPAIVERKLEDIFAFYVASFLGLRNADHGPVERIVLPTLLASDRILRMAALRAYDEYKGIANDVRHPNSAAA